MKTLLITASSIEKLEEILNKYFYSTTYEILDGEVYYGFPIRKNINLTYSVKGKKHQIHTL